MSFYEAHPDTYLELSHEDQAKLFEGESIEGEIISESPDAETTVETPQEQEAVAEQAEVTPVLLAKDGQHTIPYEELLTARDLAKHYEQIAREQAALIESLKTATPAAPEAEKPSVNDRLAELQQEFTEAKMLEETDRAQEAWSKIQAIIEEGATAKTRQMVSEEFAQRDAQAQAVQAQASLDATVSKVIEAYPFLDSTKPTANAEAISDVVTWRDALVAKGTPLHVALAQAAAKFAPLYAPKPPAADLPDAKAAAAAAIATAKAKAPSSMSSIPASATPPTDELQAMAGMSVLSAQERMMSMSPEKIMSLINKTVV